MAVLLVTNVQWQQQQEQEARAEQEEMQRREQQLRMEEERKAAAARAQSDFRNFKVIADAPWFYSDPQNNIQGPFRGEEMRQWLEAGYFKGNLPISQQNTGPFHQLSLLFPDLSVAFQARNDNAEEEARLNAEQEEKGRQETVNRAHAEARAREEAERERLVKQAEAAERERERQEAAERERRVKEEKATASKNANSGNGSSGNESSAQLKLMLGLSAQDGAAQSDVDAQQDTAPVPKASDKRNSKTSNKNSQRASKETQPSADPSKNAPPAWGGAAVVQPVSKRVCRNRRERVAALNATNQKAADHQVAAGLTLQLPWRKSVWFRLELLLLW
jgi:hypothetical protein